MSQTTANPSPKKENIWNLPNAISLYRLLSFPFLLYLIYAGNESLFATLLCINLASDAIDGIIARTFKLQTEFGARLDSMADWGTYILAFVGIYNFKMPDHGNDFWLLYPFIGLIVFTTFSPLSNSEDCRACTCTARNWAAISKAFTFSACSHTAITHPFSSLR